MRIRPRCGPSTLARIGRGGSSNARAASSPPRASKARTNRSTTSSDSNGAGLRPRNALPVVRPPEVAQPDLALSRFFASHRPLLDIELLGPARTRGSGTGDLTASTAIALPSTNPAQQPDSDYATSNEPSSSSAATSSSSTNTGPHGVAIIITDASTTSSVGKTTSQSSTPAQPGVQSAAFIINDEDTNSLWSSTSDAMKALQAAVAWSEEVSQGQEEAQLSDEAGKKVVATAQLQNGMVESVVLPESAWRRKPKQIISAEQFNRLIDDLSHQVPGDAVAQEANASTGPTLRSPQASTSASISRASPNVLQAAVKLLAHDAFCTSREAAVTRAKERGEDPSLAERLGVESELVILGEQAGPKKDWARGVALWLAEHGRAYLPPPQPSRSASHREAVEAQARRSTVSETDVSITDADTFVNVSLMNAESALSWEADGHELANDADEVDDEASTATQTDLPPADPNMLLSHALVQARLSESLPSANALRLLESAQRRQGRGDSQQDQTIDSTSVSADLDVLDLGKLNADLSDIRLPELRARARRANAARSLHGARNLVLQHVARRNGRASRRRRSTTTSSLNVARAGSKDLTLQRDRSSSQSGDMVAGSEVARQLQELARSVIDSHTGGRLGKVVSVTVRVLGGEPTARPPTASGSGHVRTQVQQQRQRRAKARKARLELMRGRKSEPTK